MGKKDLSYWDEELDDLVVVKKKKEDKHHDEHYDMFEDDDSDDGEQLPLSRDFLNHMANTLEEFLTLAKTYLIYVDISQEEYAAAKKRIKKAIRRMRKGCTNDFDYDRTMEAIAAGDIPEKYIDGGY